jgi:hypothetical protein
MQCDTLTVWVLHAASRVMLAANESYRRSAATTPIQLIFFLI